MRRIAVVLVSLPMPVVAQSLVAVEPPFNPVPLVIMLVCAAFVGGAIWLRRKRPELFAKLAGTAAKVGPALKEAVADLAEEAKVIEEALLHHPLAQPKNPAQVYVPPVAPPAVLEVPPSATVDDGILR